MSAHTPGPWNKGKGTGWVDARGYRVLSQTIGGKRRQIREHRAIMEAHLGRALEPWEIEFVVEGIAANLAVFNVEAFANVREELKRCRGVSADLLAALREIESWAFAATQRKVGEPDSFGGEARECHRLARAAIAKAEA